MKFISIFPQKLPLFLFAALTPIAFFPNAILAQPKLQEGIVKLNHSSKTCPQAIEEVKKELFRKGYFSPIKIANGKIINPTVNTEPNFIQENFYDYPKERLETIVFLLTDTQKNSVSNFYQSPKYMATLGQKVIASCKKVGIVRFSYWIEGGYPVGYFSDNTVRSFNLSKSPPECEDLRTYRKIIPTPSGDLLLMKWGHYCTL